MLAAILHPDSSDQCSFPSGLAVRATGNFVSRFKLFRSGKNTPFKRDEELGTEMDGKCNCACNAVHTVVLPI